MHLMCSYDEAENSQRLAQATLVAVNATTDLDELLLKRIADRHPLMRQEDSAIEISTLVAQQAQEDAVFVFGFGFSDRNCVAVIRALSTLPQSSASPWKSLDLSLREYVAPWLSCPRVRAEMPRPWSSSPPQYLPDCKACQGSVSGPYRSAGDVQHEREMQSDPSVPLPLYSPIVPGTFAAD